MNEKISYNDYITIKFIDKQDKMKAIEKKCVVCDRYYYITVRGLCMNHHRTLRSFKYKLRDSIKRKRLQDAIDKDPNFLKIIGKRNKSKV